MVLSRCCLCGHLLLHVNTAPCHFGIILTTLAVDEIPRMACFALFVAALESIETLFVASIVAGILRCSPAMHDNRDGSVRSLHVTLKSKPPNRVPAQN